MIGLEQKTYRARPLSNKITSEQKFIVQCFSKCARAKPLSNKIISEQKIYSTAQYFSKCSRTRSPSN